MAGHQADNGVTTYRTRTGHTMTYSTRHTIRRPHARANSKHVSAARLDSTLQQSRTHSNATARSSSSPGHQPEICAICQEKVAPNKRTSVALTPCKHLFHERCIRPWFARGKDSCPVCRSRCSLNAASSQLVSPAGTPQRMSTVEPLIGLDQIRAQSHIGHGPVLRLLGDLDGHMSSLQQLATNGQRADGWRSVDRAGALQVYHLQPPEVLDQ